MTDLFSSLPPPPEPPQPPAPEPKTMPVVWLRWQISSIEVDLGDGPVKIPARHLRRVLDVLGIEYE